MRKKELGRTLNTGQALPEQIDLAFPSRAQVLHNIVFSGQDSAWPEVECINHEYKLVCC
jgi:hypothetical protein